MKKESLTLAQLASYDDLLTDALIDRMYFWTTIRKNRGRYAACRGIREAEITDIIRATVVVDKDPAKACAQLLGLPGIKRFDDRLSITERDHFHRHLRKYVNIYLPDCPYEVATTNRYTIDTQEAATIARRSIHKGELIRHLSGIQVPITREEEKDLDLTRRDFSIVMSSRKRTPSLFLGPARFANHDCDANARLTTRGSSGMAVVAVKEIAIGEEITVSYGEDYFGISNCECLCATCEELSRNGWAPSLAQSIEATASEPELVSSRSMAYKHHKTQRQISSTNDSLGTLTPDMSTTSPPKRNSSGRRPLQLPTGHEYQRETDSVNQITVTGQPPATISRGFSIDSKSWDHFSIEELTPARSMSPMSPNGTSQRTSSLPYTSTDATSITGSTPRAKEAHSAKVTQIPFDGVLLSLVTADDSVDAAEAMPNNPAPVSRIVAEADSGSELSEMPDDCHFDDALQQIVRVKELKHCRVTRRTFAQLPRKEKELLMSVECRPSPTEIVTVSENVRKPGDYTLTTRLLSAPYSRWVSCRVCSAHFVQMDAYQTKWSCPRCERHSKLYGYQWPKTEKAGRNDKEERILDHRTIHRFVWADEEKVIRKGRRSMTASSNEGLCREARDSEGRVSTGDEDDWRSPFRNRMLYGNGGSSRQGKMKQMAQKRRHPIEDEVVFEAKRKRTAAGTYSFPKNPCDSSSHAKREHAMIKGANLSAPITETQSPSVNILPSNTSSGRRARCTPSSNSLLERNSLKRLRTTKRSQHLGNGMEDRTGEATSPQASRQGQSSDHNSNAMPEFVAAASSVTSTVASSRGSTNRSIEVDTVLGKKKIGPLQKVLPVTTIKAKVFHKVQHIGSQSQNCISVPTRHDNNIMAGKLKRPTRNASLGIAASVAAAIEGDRDEYTEVSFEMAPLSRV